MTEEKDVREALALYDALKQSPNYCGEVWNADTILSSIICDSPNYSDAVGIGATLLVMWLNADESGREVIEDTFNLLTAVEFFDYIYRCIDKTKA